ncbi:UDP-N-acetylglucosamine 2-epimerase [Serratia fonticola]|uniref:UDP-N-acetylglucosamine 2-epimerase n=1 Tax=Serratia fonticola TaxID=47917 RepID=UPI001648F27C|nr:UDP-N-acetylglucosamine 2-epimerase [Serratia fonticola]MBC3229574.1 UDP-N-acetylglucosamine 2-epimerase (hydrolyzing) [Serratia fonticola]
MKKIAVFTGTRAEYGLLYWLLKEIEDDQEFTLQLIVTGTHLSSEFGCTYKSILDDGFKIDERIEILLSSDTSVGVAKSMGLGMLSYAEALERLKSHCIIILGDRYEALAMAQTAMVMHVPVVHIHGGEITEGAYDDSFRHAITKLSHLHFTSTENHRKRVIQLGEMPENVHNVGAIGLDHITRSNLMSKNELSLSLDFNISDKFFLVTYHPVTLAEENPELTFKELLKALDNFKEYKIIMTYPNSDNGGREIMNLMNEYARGQPERVLVVPSLGQKRYLSAVQHSSVVIGNSSSGIIEVPSFKVPTVNIGMRQKGREAAKSVIHCETDAVKVTEAIQIALNSSANFLNKDICNPYGVGNTSIEILKTLKTHSFEKTKKFFDL